MDEISQLSKIFRRKGKASIKLNWPQNEKDKFEKGIRAFLFLVFGIWNWFSMCSALNSASATLTYFFKGVGMVPRKAARLENWKSWIKIFRKSGKCRKQLFLQEVDQDLREWNKICEVLILALWLFDLWSHPKREGVLISKWGEGGEILQNKLSGGRNKRGVYIFIYLRLKNNIHLFIVEYKQIAKKTFT